MNLTIDTSIRISWFLKLNNETLIYNKTTETNDIVKTTSASVNETYVEPTKFDSAEAEAKHYRSQADKLAKQAAEMRRKAEELAPAKKK